MERVYTDTFYITLYEDLKQADGTQSFYSRLMFNPTTKTAGDFRTKASLKEQVESKFDGLIPIEEFTCTETKHGWTYERFVQWLDEEQGTYEVVEKGKHTDHEVYTVDISYYTEDWNAFKNLH